MSHYDTIEFATGLAISGDVLFVACRHYGVELVDVTDPVNPAHLSTVRVGEAQSVTARDGFLYAGVWASSEVVTVNFADSRNPQITSKVALDGYGDGVDVAGDFLYAATGHHSGETPRKKPGDPGFGKGHGLEIFDLTDPAQPKWLSRIKFPPLYEIGNDTWRVTVSNGHAFVTDTYNGLFVVDVRDPLSPKPAGSLQLPGKRKGMTHGFVAGLALLDDTILLAGGDSDLHVVGAPSIAKLTPMKSVAQPGPVDPAPRPPPEAWRVYEPGGQVYGVDFLESDLAVVACGSAGVHVVELWPEVRRVFRFPTNGFATDVAVFGDLVHVAESAGGFSVFRWMTERRELQRIGHLTHGKEAIRQVEVPGDGRLALLQSGASRFLIVDVADPSVPKLVFEEARHGLLYGDQLMRGLVDDRYSGVFWHVAGFHWYDLKSSPAPSFSGDIYPERLGPANGFVAFGDRVLATARGGYLLLDRAERRPVDQLGMVKVADLRRHLGTPYVSGSRLYAANRAEGIVTVIDISKPEAPRLIEEIQTEGNPSRVSVRRDSLVIPNGRGGLIVRPVE